MSRRAGRQLPAINKVFPMGESSRCSPRQWLPLLYYVPGPEHLSFVRLVPVGFVVLDNFGFVGAYPALFLQSIPWGFFPSGPHTSPFHWPV